MRGGYITARQIETLAKSLPWSFDETRDFVRLCEKEGISLRHIVKNLDACAEQGLPLPSPYVIARVLQTKPVDDDGG